MNAEAFKLEFERIMDEYPRSYRAQKLQRVYQVFRDANQWELKQSVDIVLDTAKFAPTPQEWWGILSKVRRKSTVTTTSENDCKYCKGMGFVEVLGCDRETCKFCKYHHGIHPGIPLMKKCSNC